MVEDASVKMLEVLDRALAGEDPISYLIGTISSVIRVQCYQAAREKVVESLDTPLDDEEECALYELLPSTMNLVSSPHDVHDHTPLYEAIEALSPTQRTIILRRYGLCEHASEAPCEIERDLQITQPNFLNHERRAYGTLYFHLRTSYPAYAEDNIPLAEHRGSRRETEEYTVTTEQRRKLDEAYTALQASGQKITGATLGRAAHVNDVAATMYLKHREPERMRMTGTRTAEQRLDEAYTALQASGQKITAKALRCAAQVNTHRASDYLHQRRNAAQISA
jgi:hypothetical protein